MNKKQSKLKIIFVAPVSDNAGGIAVWLNNVLQFCNENKINTFVVNTMPKKHKGTKRNFFDRYFLSFFRVFEQKKRLKNEIKNNPKTILHIATSGSFGFFRDFVLLKTAKKFNVKTIMHYHFGRLNEVISSERGIEYWLFKKCLKFCDIHIAIDETTFNALKNKDLNVFLINNPVMPQKYSFDLKNDTYIFVGRASVLKGFYELADVFSNSIFKLNIVGKIDSKEFLYVKDRKNICVKGELSHEDTLKIISKSKCLVLPSYTEGMPFVILEAMSFGIPCIGTNVGNIANMIADSGVVIQPKNKEELFEAVDIINNDEFRLKCSKRAFSIINKEYSMNIVGNQLLKIWSE